MPSAPRVLRCSEVVPDPERWVLTEEQVPEAGRHRLVTDRVTELLLGWAERTESPVQIGSNLAVRWDRARPQIGLDPDVYVVEPPPPEGDGVVSLLLWQPGHYAPRLAVERLRAIQRLRAEERLQLGAIRRRLAKTICPG